jgi:hypothetical protein
MSSGSAWQIATIFFCLNNHTDTIANLFISLYLIATGITAFAMTLLSSYPAEFDRDEISSKTSESKTTFT